MKKNTMKNIKCDTFTNLCIINDKHGREICFYYKPADMPQDDEGIISLVYDVEDLVEYLEEDYIGTANNFNEFKKECLNFVELLNKSNKTIDEIVKISIEKHISIIDIVKDKLY